MGKYVCNLKLLDKKTGLFLSDPSPIIGLPCRSLTPSCEFNCLICQSFFHGFLQVITWICQNCTWISLNCHFYLSNLIHGFLCVETQICQNLQVYFSQLLHRSCQVDLLTWFHVCIVLCQTKPRLSLTEISKIVEISALKYGCLGSVVSLAMFLTGPFSVPK